MSAPGPLSRRSRSPGRGTRSPTASEDRIAQAFGGFTHPARRARPHGDAGADRAEVDARPAFDDARLLELVDHRPGEDDHVGRLARAERAFIAPTAPNWATTSQPVSRRECVDDALGDGLRRSRAEDA